MKIAIIGWGSLIWSSGELEIEGGWHKDGPSLPVEFSRVSKDGRLTLVLVDGVALQTTLWALSTKYSIKDVVNQLMKREGTTVANIGSINVNDKCYNDTPIESRIREWALEKKLDGLVWTSLGPKKPNGDPGLAPDNELLGYLNSLHGDKKEKAKEYVIKAPIQVMTNLRTRIGSELGWLSI